MKRQRIFVTGRVQGGGFRQAVYRLVCQLEFSGVVQNDTKGVTIELQGKEEKIDLLKAGVQIDFDIERAKTDARKLNKGIEIFPISAKTGDGFANWCDWLTESVKSLREA